MTRDIPKAEIEAQIAAQACEAGNQEEVEAIPEVEVAVPEVEIVEPEVESEACADTAVESEAINVYPEGYDGDTIIF